MVQLTLEEVCTREITIDDFTLGRSPACETFTLFNSLVSTALLKPNQVRSAPSRIQNSFSLEHSPYIFKRGAEVTVWKANSC
jgi:hypothetical protein